MNKYYVDYYRKQVKITLKFTKKPEITENQ